MKALFVSGHGLGDNIMLTPTIEKFRKVTGYEIHVATLKRFGYRCTDLYDGLGYTVHPVISDPWEIPYQEGMRRVYAEAEALGNRLDIPNILVCDTPQNLQGWKNHKIYKFADTFNISLHGDEFKTKLCTDVFSEARASRITDGRKYIVVHVEPGNEKKSLNPDIIRTLNDYCKEKTEEGFLTIEIGSNICGCHLSLNTNDMKITKALVKHASLVVAIDSVVMHIAGAFNKPLRTIWTITPVMDALPFWIPLENLEVLSYGQIWKEDRAKAIKELYSKEKFNGYTY